MCFKNILKEKCDWGETVGGGVYYEYNTALYQPKYFYKHATVNYLYQWYLLIYI